MMTTPVTHATSRAVTAAITLLLGMGLCASDAAAQSAGIVLTTRIVNGGDVELQWAGFLPPGDEWVLMRGSLVQQWETGSVALEEIYRGTGTTHVAADDPTAWPERWLYLVQIEGSTFQRSDQAFRLETSFPAPAPGTWRHLVSLPLDPDVDDTASGSSSWPCVPTGGGDGAQLVEDAACAWWSDRGLVGNGSFDVQSPSHWTCTWVGATGTASGGSFEMTFVDDGASSRDLTDIDVSQRGFMVTVTTGAGEPALENRAVIAGVHLSSFTGHVMQLGEGCLFDTLNVPFHAMYRTADELLCGLVGVDWQDADRDGDPDTCGGGILGRTGARVTVQRIDPVTQSWEARHVIGDFGGFRLLQFFGPNFRLRLGEAYLVSTEPSYTPVVYLPPHY